MDLNTVVELREAGPRETWRPGDARPGAGMHMTFRLAEGIRRELIREDDAR